MPFPNDNKMGEAFGEEDDNTEKGDKWKPGDEDEQLVSLNFPMSAILLLLDYYRVLRPIPRNWRSV